jgi:hypothetical protein
VSAIAQSTTQVLKGLRVGLGQASFGQRRQLVELLIDRVVVTDGKVEIRYVIPTTTGSTKTRFGHLRTDYFAVEPAGISPPGQVQVGSARGVGHPRHPAELGPPAGRTARGWYGRCHVGAATCGSPTSCASDGEGLHPGLGALLESFIGSWLTSDSLAPGVRARTVSAITRPPCRSPPSLLASPLRAISKGTAARHSCSPSALAWLNPSP